MKQVLPCSRKSLWGKKKKSGLVLEKSNSSRSRRNTSVGMKSTVIRGIAVGIGDPRSVGLCFPMASTIKMFFTQSTWP